MPDNLPFTPFHRISSYRHPLLLRGMTVFAQGHFLRKPGNQNDRININHIHRASIQLRQSPSFVVRYSKLAEPNVLKRHIYQNKIDGTLPVQQAANAYHQSLTR